MRRYGRGELEQKEDGQDVKKMACTHDIWFARVGKPRAPRTGTPGYPAKRANPQGGEFSPQLFHLRPHTLARSLTYSLNHSQLLSHLSFHPHTD